jgi:nucleoside-diphosphate-sugar epimerase
MGPHVALRLAAEGHDVTVFHRGITSAELPKSVGEIIGDRNKLGNFSREFARFKPDVVVDMILLTEAQANELMEVMSGIAPAAAMFTAITICCAERNWIQLR